MDNLKLTPKQESFCQKYLETGNASKAYRLSYNAENMKPETINRKAKELTDNGKIAARVNLLQSEHRERHTVTIDTLVLELNDALQVAKAKENPSAMVAATIGKARLCGLLIEKTLLETVNKHQDASRLPDSEIEAIIIAELAKDKAKTH